jgi:hypothetical protein
MASHEEARRAGVLNVHDTWHEAVAFAKETPVLFVSHQWLASDVPDPNNVHYASIIVAARLMAEELGLESEDEIYIWLDYTSIPQKCKSALWAAVSSLTAYAALGRYFVICCPPTVHGNSGLAMGGDTYLARGWCAPPLLLLHPPPSNHHATRHPISGAASNNGRG